MFNPSSAKTSASPPCRDSLVLSWWWGHKVTKTSHNLPHILPLQVVTLSGIFIFCWSPYAVLSLAAIFGFAPSIPVSFTVIPLQFAKTSILWNAIILVIMNPMVKNRIYFLIFTPPFPSSSSQQLWTVSQPGCLLISHRTSLMKAKGMMKRIWPGKLGQNIFFYTFFPRKMNTHVNGNKIEPEPEGKYLLSNLCSKWGWGCQGWLRCGRSHIKLCPKYFSVLF